MEARKSGLHEAYGRPAVAETPAPAMRVSLGFLDGTSRTGRLAKFAPRDADLVLETDAAGTAIVPAERVAYIAFHRAPGAKPEPPPSGITVEHLKVHVAGGRIFAVAVASASIQSNLGFRGWPSDGDSVFDSIHFYAHGVRAKEANRPLGEMLVESGMVESSSLGAALRAHEVSRLAPIGQILVERGEVDAAALEQAARLQARRKLRIGQILVEEGLATAQAVERALAEQKQRKGKRLGEMLVEMGIVSELDLTLTLGQKFQMPFVDLDQYRIDDRASASVARDVIARYGVLPIAMTTSSVTVAVGDPAAVDAIDALRLHTRKRIDEVIVVPSQLRRYVEEHLRARSAAEAAAQHQSFETLLDALRHDNHAGAVAGAEIEEDEDTREISAAAREADGGVVRLVNQIIVEAHRRGASDIHLEPNGKDRGMVVRFRVDGECSVYQEIPGAYRNQVIARVKIMASLDISERRKPQDGKIRFRLGDRLLELRVATLPTVNGNEDAVLRLLASSKPRPLDQMGLSERNLRELRNVTRQPYGLFLCVGPTGSGKTTALHSALSELNTKDTKIWTAEDPVEITQPGLRQVQVQPKVGLTFANAMRAFLRADPDVIMVGEMRDLETASTAVEASLTGHLVLSTLHTNSAPETITRLLDMGLDPFSFSDSLLGILAQRLARALCAKCRAFAPATDKEMADIVRAFGDEERMYTVLGLERGARPELAAARGCEACNHTGYKGRLALHELFVVDDESRRAVARKAPVAELRALAVAQGMTTLLQDGIAKVLAGQTDLKQVLAVASK